jgi:hypothetical protein
MSELELESAELLPTRETLNVCRAPHGGSSSYSSTSYSFTQVGYGNSAGFINVPILDGDLNNVSVNVLSL